jgi:RpiB/LacA/LacB family sugar-phosphate isomerase
MQIEIGSDHRGYQLKRRVITWLEQQGHQVTDHGCDSTEACDYPDQAYAVARAVAAEPQALGVLICSNGVGMSMCANRVPGIRAALCISTAMASQSRRHNNANVLALGADNLPVEETLRVLATWLEATFEGGRHIQRVEKMTAGECRASRRSVPPTG